MILRTRPAWILVGPPPALAQPQVSGTRIGHQTWASSVYAYIFLWFITPFKIILIPGWVGQVCLLLGDSLTTSERASCQRITGRSYNTFLTGINGVSAITGANTLDIASIGIDQGFLTANASLVSDGYARVHSELVIRNTLKADGIRADGSFGEWANEFVPFSCYITFYRTTYGNPVQWKLWWVYQQAFKAPKRI